MAYRKPTERTNKFLEITDPKKAVGLWSYHAVRETAMTPVGNTFKALGRFLPEDIARWKRRGEMAAAMGSVKKGVSSARVIAKFQEKCKQDERRLPLVEWRTKYRWLFLWQNYACRLRAPEVVAAEPDTQMFFNAPSAGITCHEGELHSGRVFFLRTKVKVEGEDGSKPKSEVEVEQWKFNYFVCVVLKPGGTKWWSQIDKTNVTWTDNVYDRLIIDPRGGLSWSPILAEVINERVHEKDICLFMLDDDPLFKAITDSELNPHEKYAHLCYAFDFFCRDAESDHRSFYLRWSVFFNPKKGKFDSAHKSKPRVIEIYGERKKGWTTRRFEVKEGGLGIRDWGLDSGDSGLERKGVDGRASQVLKYASGKRKPVGLAHDDATTVATSDAKLGLGDTPLDKYAQDAAQWVAANNGCAVLPVGSSREMRLALSHALFFVTFPDRKPNEPGGILRGYQLPGRLVEHAPGKIRGNMGNELTDRMKKISEDTTARRRKEVVDCLLARACTAVALRNKNILDEQGVVRRMNEIGARQIIEMAAWQRGFMEGNALNQFKPGPMAGVLKLPDLSLALCFERKLGLKGETAGDEMVVQTAPIRSLKESQGAIRSVLGDAYSCRSLWKPRPEQEKEPVAYPSDSVRILRDEGRYYLMAVPRYGYCNVERDLAFEPDVPGKPRYRGLGIRDRGLGKGGVPVCAYSIKSGSGGRSRADTYVVEETYEYNKLMKLAQEGRIYLYAIDFGRDQWLADLVYSAENKRPCKVVPSIPVLTPVGMSKSDALDKERRSGTNTITRLSASSENGSVFITFTFNPTVPRDNRKVEGRSWTGYCGAFPAEAQRTVVRWPDSGTQIANAIRNKRPFSDVATTARVESSSSVAPTPQSKNGQLASLAEALQRVIETDGILLTDKEHIEEAVRAATYVIPQATNNQQPTTNNYNGYNLKDRIFCDTDGRLQWRIEQGKVHQKREDGKFDHQEYVERLRKENRGKPLYEVLSPDLAKAAEVEFTRQIEADTLVDAKTPKDFKLDEPIRVTDDFKEAVAREFRRIAYTGTMGWRKKLNRPAHEVAVGIWLAGLKPDSGLGIRNADRVRDTQSFDRIGAARPLETPSGLGLSPSGNPTLSRGRIPTARVESSSSVAPTPQLDSVEGSSHSPDGQLASEGQKKRLKTLDALLAEGLVTQEEYAAKKAEILG